MVRLLLNGWQNCFQIVFLDILISSRYHAYIALIDGGSQDLLSDVELMSQSSANLYGTRRLEEVKVPVRFIRLLFHWQIAHLLNKIYEKCLLEEASSSGGGGGEGVGFQDL